MNRKVITTMMTVIFLTFVLMVATVPVQASTSKTFTVSPTGIDDTANIQTAFDSAVTAGPGSIVKLTAGHFYSNNILVKNFRGTFEGAGEDLTVIDTLRGKDPNAPGLKHLLKEDGFLFFFGFRDGDIIISDMTFDITAYKPANTWLSFPWEANPCNDARNVIRIMGTINSVIERVRFIGHEGTISEGGENYNVGWCLTVSGIQSYIHKHYHIEPVLGSCTVSDCAFEHVAGGINMAYVVNGNVIVTHTVFTGGTSIGAFLWDFVDSTGEFSYNQLERFNFLGFACGQGLVYSIEPEGGAYLGPLPTNALYLIHDNTFFATGISEAIDLWDYMPVKTLDATVKDNDISMDTQTPAESYVGGGICGWPIHDVKIINNKITGITGLAGIYLGGGSTGCMISGNMLGDLKSDKADIWLAQDTSYCMVVAMKDTTVLDEGVNNKIVGS